MKSCGGGSGGWGPIYLGEKRSGKYEVGDRFRCGGFEGFGIGGEDETCSCLIGVDSFGGFLWWHFGGGFDVFGLEFC